jgi:L-lactate dehydrogenase complex protein LldG
MNAKEEILNLIREQSVERFEMPDLSRLDFPEKDLEKDNEERFINSCRFAGGKAILLDEEAKSLKDIIRELYPEAQTIVGNLSIKGVSITNPDEYDDPRQLNNIDLSIIEGQFGVAENGAVWVTANVKHRVIYFIAKNLIILLNRNNIVSTMHRAYHRINDDDYDFGVFISGPSKTADIEQSLVIGAHGAISTTVVLYCGRNNFAHL